MDLGGQWEVLAAEGTSRSTWEAALREWPEVEVVAHPAYLSLYATDSQRPLGLLYRSARGTVLHSVMQRDIADPRTGQILGSDLTSPPFGYGGPFVIAGGGVDARTLLLQDFYRAFRAWAASVGVVAEYAIFSPLVGAPAEYPGSVVPRLPTVVRDLTLSESELWNDYDRSIRSGVLSARAQGLSFTVDLEGEHSDRHLAVHHAVLDHRGGGIHGHRLTQDFVTAMKASLGGHFVYFHVWQDGEVIGSDLCLLSARTAVAFRGGVRPDRYSTRAGALLSHESFLWCKETRRSSYLLGGGISGSDALFRHKRYYAPNGVRQLETGQWVLDPARYLHLVEERRAAEAAAGRHWPSREDYFPAYRSP